MAEDSLSQLFDEADEALKNTAGAVQLPPEGITDYLWRSSWKQAALGAVLAVVPLLATFWAMSRDGDLAIGFALVTVFVWFVLYAKFAALSNRGRRAAMSAHLNSGGIIEAELSGASRDVALNHARNRWRRRRP